MGHEPLPGLPGSSSILCRAPKDFDLIHGHSLGFGQKRELTARAGRIVGMSKYTERCLSLASALLELQIVPPTEDRQVGHRAGNAMLMILENVVPRRRGVGPTEAEQKSSFTSHVLICAAPRCIGVTPKDVATSAAGEHDRRPPVVALLMEVCRRKAVLSGLSSSFLVAREKAEF